MAGCSLVDESTSRQFDVILEIRQTLGDAGIAWWLFGGWGLDASIGRVTRSHSDIEFWVARTDGDSTRDALVTSGFVALDTKPLEESREFTRYGVVLSSAFFDTQPDQSFRPQGRWSDWVFPAGSFGDSLGRLGEVSVPTMSVEGMIAMKEQYAFLRNGKPLREKDVRDMALLRQLID
jgi:hypothetical protein